jgi:AcrR family transcriptional regulator
MARPKSENKRQSILAAAVRVIAAQGLAAPTAAIAKEAGVANGSLFNYFATKAELFNQLYLELKAEAFEVSMGGMAADADLRTQTFHLWSRWMKWAAAGPEKRKAFAQLCVADEITPETRALAGAAMAPIITLVERIRAGGVLAEQPLPFVFAILESLSGATMDFMIADPERADAHCKAGFEALWRAVA